MSILDERTFKCSNCGHESEQRYFLSWNSLVNGSITIHGFDAFGPNLLMECPNCGYVSTNLERKDDKLTNEAIEEVNKLYDEKYGNLFEAENYSREYLKYYLTRIREDNYDLSEAIFALAKALYYNKNNPNKKILIDELKQLLLEVDEEDETHLINYLDLLRENEEFEFVKENLSRCHDNAPAELIELEAEYCENKDSRTKRDRF